MDLPTTASSNIIAGLKTPFEATVVKLLKEHGADTSLKTDLDEFGMGSHTQTAASGPALSPFKRDGVALSPGGSSGGSAIAVATGQTWAALGTDTGGSVRLPAAYTTVVGFKPSYGLLSRWGVIQYANSLDTVGVLSRDVTSARQIFDAINAFDSQDPSSLSTTTRARIDLAKRPLPISLRIGVPIEYNITELAPAVRDAWMDSLRKLRELGHSIHAVSLPTTQQALSAYYILAPAEASSNLAKYDGIRYGRRPQYADTPERKLPLYARARDQGFGDEVKRRILLGAYSLSSEAIDNYFMQAQKIRRLVQLDFNKVFAMQNPLLDQSDVGNVDILVAPTAPTLPPTVEEIKKLSPLEIYMNDVFTIPASLAGLPAISIPAPLARQHSSTIGPEDVQSVGLQILGQFGDDETVLQAGERIYSAMKEAS